VEGARFVLVIERRPLCPVSGCMKRRGPRTFLFPQTLRLQAPLFTACAGVVLVWLVRR